MGNASADVARTRADRAPRSLNSGLLGELAPAEVRRSLRRDGLRLHIGPFVARVHSPLEALWRWLPVLYGDYRLAGAGGFSDFHVALAQPRGLRRWWRPQVCFRLDAHEPFKPLPRSQALPFFEWGLNWSIAVRAQQYVVLHAAVVGHGDRVLLMPGSPGVGKSTLCAGLVARGWRLFSDELALLEPETGLVYPIPRPLSLKGTSIEVVRQFAPAMTLGPSCHDTAKGTVAHARPPGDSLARASEPARVGWLVFPQFQLGTSFERAAIAPEDALRTLIGCTFNYPTQGARGFHALVDLIDRCPPVRLTYGDLERACAEFSAIAEAAEAPA